MADARARLTAAERCDTPEVRCEAVRSLLLTPRPRVAVVDGDPVVASYEALDLALQGLERASPKAHAAITRYSQRYRTRVAMARDIIDDPETVSEAGRRNLERIYRYLAQRMPAEIALPGEGKEWDDWRDEADEDDYSSPAVHRGASASEHTLAWAFGTPSAMDGRDTEARNAGWGLEGKAASWAPRGRPATGSRKPERAVELLLERIPDSPIDDIRAVLGKRGPSRDPLRLAVYDIRERALVTPDALASALGKAGPAGVRMVQRLANEGAALTVA